MKQVLDPDEMNGSYHDDTDDGKYDYDRYNERKPAIRYRKMIKWIQENVYEIYGDDKHNHDEKGVDRHRTQRVNAAHPAAAQGLHIKLFEQPDTGADQDGIENAEGDRAALRQGRQPGQHG